ncbi:voltage-dependent calcium channel gamma-like subunit [Pseudophryne corroboree]|uniref:voltage-dependent calcium channel gamma-like subunit n=1 Tax=Pseudophryne corroboree TaxID=495146 RepID=UPI00308183B5
MTAIGVQQLQKTMKPQLRSRMFFETFLRVMITLSAGSAIVLSSISVCDGQWLSSPGEQLFGVWDTCRKDAGPQCSQEMAQLSRVMVVVRTTVTLAVVLAIFGLELLMVSQLCDDGHSRKKWNMGSVLLLVSFFLSAIGTLTYVFYLSSYTIHSSFTLTFWSQFLGVFLFFLNGSSGLYFNHLIA